MAMFQITTKSRKQVNGIRIEPGMPIQIVRKLKYKLDAFKQQRLHVINMPLAQVESLT